MIEEHLKLLSKNLELQFSKYKRSAFIGDFNLGMENEAMKDFCKIYKLTSFNNKPTCYKNTATQSSIDLILTICPKYFQNTTVIETGPSDFHKMVATIFRKLEPKIVHHRNYRNFKNELFRESLVNQLSVTEINKNDGDRYKYVERY